MKQKAAFSVEPSAPSGSSLPAAMHDERFDLGSLVFFGFGLYWAWLWVFDRTPVFVLFSHGIVSPNSSGLEFVGYASSVVVLLCAALLARRLESRTGTLLLLFGGGACAILSTALHLFCSDYSLANWMATLGMVLAGVARACFNLLWGVLCCRLGLKRGTVFMLGSVAIGALLTIATAALHPILAALVALCLPALATAALIQAHKRANLLGFPTACSSATDETLFPFKPLARLFAGIFIYAIAHAFVLQLFFSIESENVPLVFELAFLGVVILGFSIAIVAYRLPHGLNLSVAYRFVLPIAAAGFLLISLLEGDAQSLAAAFVFIGFTAFDVITWLALAHASNRLGISAIKTFGFGRAVHFLGMTTGALIAEVVIQPNGAFADFFAPVSLAFAFSLVVASTLILTERNLFLSGKETRSKDSPEEQPEGPSPAPSSDIEQRCDAIARTFGLTQREKDVLALLAKGRDTVRIQAELNVSNHTIRSHVYHIYQKLGIHSRQDLIDLIEETEPN